MKRRETLEFRARALSFTLALSALASFASITADSLHLQALRRVASLRVSLDALTRLDLVTDRLALVGYLLRLGSTLAFALWIFTLFRCVSEAKITVPRWTPARAVFASLCPVLHLALPPFALRSLARAIEAAPAGGGALTRETPFGYRDAAQPLPRVSQPRVTLWAWWSLWITSRALDGMPLVLARATRDNEWLPEFALADVLSGVLGLLAALMGLRVVRALTAGTLRASLR